VKIGFSTVGCPTWDLPTIVSNAKAMGYQGVELRGLRGQLNLPLCPELTADPDATKALFGEAGVELVCLGSSAAFHHRDRFQVADNQAEAREYIELAGKLGCPFVRVFGAEIPWRPIFGYERREAVLGRIARALRELVPCALEHRVTLLIENSGDFVDSQAMWFLVDAAESPAVMACWSQFAAMTRAEPASISIKRLGRMIGMVRVCDGKFAGGGVESIELPGTGDVNVPLIVELLRGLAFDGYLMFDWPKLWNSALAEPEKAFPEAQKYLRSLLDAKKVELTAYKGDKNAPRFRTRREPLPTPV
jgi:sugar phosphate isomerase/epimerase